jgi:hypothetical protein
MGDSTFLHAVLNGDVVWLSQWEDWEDLESLNEMQKALALHKQVADQEMTSHEFINDNHRHQRTTFADGTTVAVDFAAGTYDIKYGEALP